MASSIPLTISAAPIPNDLVPEGVAGVFSFIKIGADAVLEGGLVAAGLELLLGRSLTEKLRMVGCLIKVGLRVRFLELAVRLMRLLYLEGSAMSV